jgi:hypothetical protein
MMRRPGADRGENDRAGRARITAKKALRYQPRSENRI